VAGQQNTDPIITWVVIFGMLAAATYGIWLMGYKQIGPVLIAIKQYELYPLTFISDSASYDYDQLGQLYYQSRRMTSQGHMEHEQMWDTVVIAGKYSGRHYRKMVGSIFLAMITFVLLFRKSNQFKTAFKLESIIGTHAIRWPVITPFIKFNPSKGKHRAPGARVPVDLPLFAEALYPEEWMAHNRIRVINGVPDRDQIRRALLPQLCDRFEGIDALPEHLYCLLAAFALKGGRKRSECDALLGEVAKCWTPESGFVPTSNVKSQAARALGDQKLVGPLLDVMNRHAYVATAFLAALKWARRQGGVLAPAQFVWLRGLDRTMWYPLNNLDRRAFHVEASGAMAHYMAEVEAGRPLTVPRLDAAVVAIVQYISENRPRIPELEGGSATDKRLPDGKSNMLMIGNDKKK